MLKMNKLFTLAVLAMPLMFTSCAKDDDEEPINNTGGEFVVSGEITSNTTWTSNNTYILTGGVHVKNNVVLTIQPGTIIESNPNEPSVAYLLMERGSKIMAEGSSEFPIVFTSGESDPSRGDWGGIIICGKASINNFCEAVSGSDDVFLFGLNKFNNPITSFPALG